MIECVPSILNGKYKLLRPLGSGSYGQVFLGEDSETSEEVAVKIDLTSHTNALAEGKILKLLSGVEGIPACYWSGVDMGRHVLVLELVGENLESLMKSCGNRLSENTVWEVAKQCLERLREIHEKDIVHRDIKPENFAPGLRKKANTIFLLDFGLAKFYRDPIGHQHVFYKEGKGLTGTARFASINSHMGIELSRRDDLESLCYMLIYFLKGRLPWQCCLGFTKDIVYYSILHLKSQTRISDLCLGCPPEVMAMLQYCRGLRFEDKPDYEYLSKLFERPREATLAFDWTIRGRRRDSRTKRCRMHPERLRRSSELTGEFDFTGLLKKKSLSETPPVHCNDSETTCVNNAYRPVITSELKLKAELFLARSAGNEYEPRQKPKRCTLF